MPQLFGFDPVSIRGPKPLPIIGVVRSFYELLDDPVAVLMRLRERGEVVALIDRSPAVVCAFGAERNREVLSNPSVFQHDETLFRGPPGSAMEKMRWSSVTINGELHRRHRRLMQPAFQRSALDAYAAEIVAVTRRMLGRWKVGEVEAVDGLCRDAALTMAMKCLYGVDVSGEAHDLGHMAAEWVHAATDPMAFLLPLDLPGTPYRRMVKLGEAVVGRIRALMEHKRGLGGEQKDALALLMSARDEDETSLSDDELVAEAASLFVAAHETTAWTLAWTLLLLDQHPEAHTTLVTELEAVLGDRDPGPEDLPRMVVLDRVVKESMRILSSVPMLFMRVCAEATTVGGFAVPRGCNVLLSPLATHHDPALYPEPRRFLPDRWIGKTPAPYGYLPFGAGPRTCVGMLFAERALRLMLPMILRRFRLSIPEGTRIDRLTRGNILKTCRGLPMRIEPAGSPSRKPARIAGNLRDLVEC
jgi:cytochrome P450